MATIEMWLIKYMTLVAGWLLLPPICHLYQDYHNRILLGMRQRMRGSQLDGFLQAWTNFPPCMYDTHLYKSGLHDDHIVLRSFPPVSLVFRHPLIKRCHLGI